MQAVENLQALNEYYYFVEADLIVVVELNFSPKKKVLKSCSLNDSTALN